MRILNKILAGVLTGALSCSLFGAVPQFYMGNGAAVAEAAGAVNILDYEKNTSASEYAIYDVAGMEYLAELVNENGETFEGKTIKLESDLEYDKSIDNNHTIIGDFNKDEAEFDGYFDGQNHIIKGVNVYYDERFEDESAAVELENIYVGFFGGLGGHASIQSLQLKDSKIIDVSKPMDETHYISHKVGGIAGGIVRGGYFGKGIKNCYIHSDVEISGKNIAGLSVTNYIGGIIGYVYGNVPEIRGCINEGMVNGSGSGCWVGGIVGELLQGLCVDCINRGIISQGGMCGGIVGYKIGGNVRECCNYGKISGSGCVGGIAGREAFVNKSVLVNCYNAGEVDYDDAENYRTGGGIAGEALADGKYSSLFANVYNCGKIKNSSGVSFAIGTLWMEEGNTLGSLYWLDGSADYGIDLEMDSDEEFEFKPTTIYKKTSAQMKEKAFLDKLNANSLALGYGEVWEADTKGINSGYPILKNIPYDGNFSDISSDDAGESYVDPEEPAETGAAVFKLYKDYTYQNPVREDSIRLYANGGTVTKDNVKTNYKSYTLYTKILPSYIYKLDTKGKLKKANGKVVVGITSTKIKPELNAKGKIVDEKAAKIAKASIANGQITVTAQTMPGTVYLWVMDTGDLSKSSDEDEVAQTYTCCPVTVRSAPTVIGTYSTSNITYGTTKKYTSKSLKVGEATDIYLYPVYKDSDRKMQKAEDATYEAVPANGIKDYIEVTKTDKETFRIRAIGLKNGKTVSGKVTIKCNQNGKKATFTVTVKK